MTAASRYLTSVCGRYFYIGELMKDIIDKLIELGIDTTELSERDLEKIQEYVNDPEFDFIIGFQEGLKDRENEIRKVYTQAQNKTSELYKILSSNFSNMIDVCNDNTTIFGVPQSEQAKGKIISSLYELLKGSLDITSRLEDMISLLYNCASEISELREKYDDLLFESELIGISAAVSCANADEVIKLKCGFTGSLDSLYAFSRRIFETSQSSEALLTEIKHAFDRITLKLDISNDGLGANISSSVEEIKNIRNIVLNATNSDRFDS